MQAAFEAPHIRNAQGTKIEDGAGAIGDNVGASPAFDDIGVDRSALAQSAPTLYAGDLSCQLVDRVDPLFRGKAGMRCAAMHDDLSFAYAFARSLQQTARPQSGFQHKNSIAAARFCFN